MDEQIFDYGKEINSVKMYLFKVLIDYKKNYYVFKFCRQYFKEIEVNIISDEKNEIIYYLENVMRGVYYDF